MHQTKLKLLNKSNIIVGQLKISISEFNVNGKVSKKKSEFLKHTFEENNLNIILLTETLIII